MSEHDDTVTVSRLEDHNRGSDPINGPDYCVECSKALQWWVPWPCGYVRAVAATTAEVERLRAALSEPSPDRPERCPTCDGDGPDRVDEDFTSGGVEMECGDDWHDLAATPTGEADKVSIVVTTDVQCDVCLAWEHGVTGPSTDARRARITVARLGWVRRKRDGLMVDLCPGCAGEAEHG